MSLLAVLIMTALRPHSKHYDDDDGGGDGDDDQSCALKVTYST